MRFLLGGFAGLIAALLMSLPALAHEGCHVTVEQQGDGGFFAISGTDFEANEHVDLQLVMNDQPVFPDPLPKTADESGAFADGVSFTEADPEGEYTLTATAESCTAETTFQWGLPDTATDTPQTQEALPIGLAIAVIAGVLAFGYFFMRPSRMSGPKD